MKTQKIFFMLLLAIPLLFNGCKKDDDTKTTNEYVMTATINGTEMTFNAFVYTYDGSLYNAWSIQGTGPAPDYASISIYVDSLEFHGVGTYSIPSADGNVINTADYIPSTKTYATDYSTNSSHTGQLTISSMDASTVSGTFSFTAEDGGSTVTVTNGTFKAKNK